jgi:pilus assembly protein Flp/PilA
LADWRTGLITRFLRCKTGATAIEYALVAAVISIVILGATSGIGARLNAKFLGPVMGGFG